MNGDESSASGASQDAGPARAALWLAVAVSGAAGLTWEVLWQHHAALALGISAYGTAVTLAALMAGLGIGSLIAGRLARAGRVPNPLRAYGIAELILGVSGFCVPYGLAALARLDTQLYARSPGLAELAHALGVGVVLLPPAAAMGATLPLLAPLLAGLRTKLPTLYAFNTAGAVLGVVSVTFVSLPLLGVQRTACLGAGLNMLVGAWAVTRAARQRGRFVEAPAERPPASALALAFASAFVVFVLEVAWFRAFRAVLAATTETFSILLAAFLIALALGAWYAPRIRARFPGALPILLALAAVAVLYTTRATGQLELYLSGDSALPSTPLVRFVSVLGLVVVPIALLGMALDTGALHVG